MLLFIYNQKFYQLLKVNGAKLFNILNYELVPTFVFVIISIFLGYIFIFYLSINYNFPLSELSIFEYLSFSIIFLCFILLISLIPILVNYQKKLQLRNNYLSFNTKGIRNISILQYTILLIVLFFSIGVKNQMDLIQLKQIGGNEKNILITSEVDEPTKEKFELLKSDLLNFSEIESVTTAMQAPGVSIRDALFVWKEKDNKEDARQISFLLVGDDFCSFFNIKKLIGSDFKKNNITYNEEKIMLHNYYENDIISMIEEEYIINNKALEVLGFKNFEDAIGSYLFIEHGDISYINKGKIISVIDDFMFTNAFDNDFPLIIIQRKLFQHQIFLRFANVNSINRHSTLDNIFDNHQIDQPLNFSYLNEIYNDVYHNEFSMKRIIYIFLTLNFLITILGLIIHFMYYIKGNTKEICIRKINGATSSELFFMYYSKIMMWIILSLIFSIPITYIGLNEWKKYFAYKSSFLHFDYLYSLIILIIISLASISYFIFTATKLNPIISLKSDN